MGLNEHVLGETVGSQSRTVGSALAEIKSLCDQQLTHEAKTMLELTAARFEHVRDQLLSHSHSDATNVFVKALAKFWTRLYAHSTNPLATRVVDCKYLIQDLTNVIHGGDDGLDGVVRMLRGNLPSTGKEELWKQRGEFEKASQEYEAALRRSIVATVAAWKTNVVTHKTLIEQADRVFRLAEKSKDDMQWKNNALVQEMDKEVSQLAADALKHVLNNDKPTWFIEKVTCDIEIASGSFGTVHHGKMSAHDDAGGAKVVVKKLKPNSKNEITDDMKKQFIKEVDLWVQLMHPYVLRIFGANHTATPPYMVCEYAEKGDLSNYLATEAGKKRFWRMLYHVSLGIGYLHEKNIIHGDLKLDNFVLANDNYARVTDFSLTRVKLSSDLYSTVPNADIQSAGALRWRAPECVGPYNVSPQLASDVYSFGMCVFEAFGKVPYEYLQDERSIVDLIEKAKLPDAKHIPADALELITSITHKDPKDRPTIHEVSRRLWKFVAAEEEREEKEKEATTSDKDKQKDNLKLKLVCISCEKERIPDQSRCTCGATATKSQLKIESKADLPRVMELLNSQVGDQQHNAMQALQSYICQDLVQQKEVYDACAIAVLAKIVNDTLEKQHVQREAMVTLACSVIGHEPAQKLMRDEKAVARLMQIVKSGPDPLKCKAANSLGYASYRNETIYNAVIGEADLLKLVNGLPDKADTRRDRNRALKMLTETSKGIVTPVEERTATVA